MAEKEEAVVGENTTPDWEVVSLTASAYAAAPGGPKQLVDLKDDEVTRYELAETSHPLYMSRHFDFPPSEHENIAVGEPEIYEDDDKVSSKKKKMEEDFGFSVETEPEMGARGKEKDGDLMTLKGLNLSDEFTGLEFFDEEKSKREEEENIYKTAISSLEDERAIGGSHAYEQNETNQELIEPVVTVVSPTKDEKKKKDEVTKANTPLPCEAWWKRSAASLISQAKETNTVWSIFVAAAVMGIVILGQRWQQEKWQVLQLKWESSIGNEKGGRLIGPISRLKQAFVVGGQRRESFIRISSQNDS